MAAIFAVSAMDQPPMPPVISFSGGHVVAYAGLTFLVLRALSGGLPVQLSRSIAVRALVIAIAYGISDELHQLFVPGRTADVLDVMADAAGAFLTLGACRAWDILDSALVSRPSPHSRDADSAGVSEIRRDQRHHRERVPGLIRSPKARFPNPD
jgi:hypothetical protein